jgi:hypothetical protein
VTTAALPVDQPWVAEAIREVTDEEAAFFREHGWAKLDGLLSRDLAAALLERARSLVEEGGKDYAFWELYVSAPTQSDDRFRRVGHSAALGEAAARVTGIRPLRHWSDSIMCKAGSRGAAGKATYFHQDWPTTPIDRPFGAGFWIALDEITPEMGSLRYLSGSHREGSLGRIAAVPGGERAECPWLFEKYELAPAPHLQPGDALIHHWLTFHGASPNASDRHRWAWSKQVVAADALYTGAPLVTVDHLGLVPGEPLDHPWFPLVAA